MKRFIGLVVVLCILLCTLAVAANEPPHSDITWNVENGILTIKGTGAMEDYKSENEMPWYDKRSEITQIVVEDGITHIGNMAFYGLKNAKKAVIADSVQSVGICAFSYTEGTRTNLGNLGADFQFTPESNSAVVSKGDIFTLTVTLSGDFKNVSAVQTAIIYDKELIAIDSETCFDEEWLSGVDETNLGYISSPLSGTVANNLRLAYVSLSGVYIDEEAPLYSAGKTDVIIAKVNCTALGDIEDVSTGVLMLKNSAVGLISDGKSISATVGENQLTACTRLPIPGLTIESGSTAVLQYAKDNGLSAGEGTEIPESGEKTEAAVPEEITVKAKGGNVVFDTNPFINENGSVMVPLRAVMEQMGVAVIWDNETQTVFMATEADFAATQLGKKYVFKNETSIELDEVSVARDQRTLVSMDFFSKAFGFETNWDEPTKTLTIK